MTDKVVRGGLVVLGLFGLQLGVWATLAPRSFYDDFPGAGRSWIAVDGPYNEHLVRDFGALDLALTAVVAVALTTRVPAAVRAAALAWLVYSVPHFAYHVRHVHVFDTSDKVLALAGIGGAGLVSAAVLIAEWSGRQGRATPPAVSPSPSPSQAVAPTPADDAG